MRTIWFLIFLFTTSSSYGQDGITLGYINGNEYLEMPDDNRTVWIVGVMDGLMAEAALVSKAPKGPWLGRCLRGISIPQIREMFEQKLRQQPDSWHAPAAFIFRDRMSSFCKNRA